MNCEETRERLLAHLYSALDDGEDAEVRAHLRACGECRTALAAAEGERDVLAEAARAPGEDLEFRPPAPRRRLLTRGRFAAAAAVLLAVAGLLLYRTALRAPVLVEHPRYVVTGPDRFLAGEDVEYEIRKETIAGDPLPLDGYASLNAASGAEVFDRRPIEGRGRATVRFPGGAVEAGAAAYLRVAGAPALPVTALHPEALGYVATDKPLYRPGEVIRMRAVVLSRFRLEPVPDREVRFLVTSPRGDLLARLPARTSAGVASAELRLDGAVAGGEYTISLASPAGDLPGGERKVAVRAYRVPRLALDLELDRESYGPGEAGAAWLSVLRAEGGVPDGATVRATLAVDDEDRDLEPLSLPASGTVKIPFSVPAGVESGRALLTAVVSDGGNVESRAATVPISLGRLDVELLPEGGELVAGLPGRVYFRVRSPDGAPADLVADVVDDRGRTVAPARTEVQGLGRFALSPEPGRTYRLVPRSPAGIELAGAEIAPVPDGVSLAAAADAFPAGGEIAVDVASTLEGDHEVLAYCRGQLLARRTVTLAPGEPARVSLAPAADVGGVVRVTVLGPEGRPRAERLVAREPARRLSIDVEPERGDLSPGDATVVRVRTRDAGGEPVRAALGVSVVDDSVLALADAEDATPLPWHYLLGLEVSELENWARFPGDDRATDRLLGTQGWRRFAWRDPAALVAEHGEAARRIVPAGREAGVVRADNLEDARRAAAEPLAAADRRVARAAGILLLMLGVGAGFALLVRVRPIRVPATAGAWAAAGLGALLVVISAEAPIEEARGNRPVAVADAPGAMDALEPQDAVLGLAPDRGVFFNDGEDGDFRGRVENLFDEVLVGARIAGAPVYSYTRTAAAVEGRSDFEEVLYWNPLLLTDEDGRAEFSFTTGDSITTFRIRAEGHDAAGGLGLGESAVRNRIPFHVEPKLPAELGAGDRLELPVVVSNATNEVMDVDLSLELEGELLRLEGEGAWRLRVPASGSARALRTLVAGEGRGEVGVTLAARAPGGLADRVIRRVPVVPRGYPMEVARGGRLSGDRAEIRFLLPPEMDRESLAGGLTIYPSALSTLLDGLESLLRTPGGCFEQASSTNYPNTMILSYLSRTETGAPEVARRAKSLLEAGYGLLTSYECESRGYEWFGADPANPALTAYGLLEFTDMAEVHDVDREMIERTRDWLLAGRDGEGGFRFGRSRALDSFGRAPADVTEAYVLWALTEADRSTDLSPELSALAGRAKRSEDPYVVALAALALGNRGDPAAGALVARLASMQAGDGSLAGATTSITSSRGENLVVETTALAALAFLRDPARRAEAEAAVDRLVAARRGGGSFGATQATILALKALVEHAKRSAIAEADLDLRILVNGRDVARGSIREGMRDALVFERAVLDRLVPGENRVEIVRSGEGEPPFALSVSYHTAVPPADAACAVRLETMLSKTDLREGDSVVLTARIENREEAGIPMTLARIGLPAGLVPRTERLAELVNAGEIAFFETRPREVTLYLRGMTAGEERELRFDLSAGVPGTFEGPASSAYLYYTDDVKWWTPPLSVRIRPSR